MPSGTTRGRKRGEWDYVAAAWLLLVGVALVIFWATVAEGVAWLL